MYFRSLNHFLYYHILNKTDDLEPEEELLNDLLQIINVYVLKMNG
jgi:hypothetical protein